MIESADTRILLAIVAGYLAGSFLVSVIASWLFVRLSEKRRGRNEMRDTSIRKCSVCGEQYDPITDGYPCPPPGGLQRRIE